MRLIDADEIEELFYKQVEYGATDLMDAFDDALQDAQTIEAEPVRHGRWVVERHRSHGKYSHCSECGLVRMTADTPDLKFCSRCGAKMDGDSNE